MQILERTYLGASLFHWLIALGAAGALFLVLLVTIRTIARRLDRIAQRTTTDLDDLAVDVLRHTHWITLLVVALSVGLEAVPIASHLGRIRSSAITLAAFLQLGLWLQVVIRYATERVARRRGGRPGAAFVGTFRFLLRLLLWSVLALFALDNIGVNITSLIAGLGIGGIAIALALQNILGDLFASLSIALDTPFEVGDFIVVDDYLGSVEYIGLKTTRLRSLSGEQIVFSNTDLLKSRIRNYQRMNERRVVFTFGVTYETPAAAVERIPGIVRGIIGQQAKTRFDRAHFKEFGQSALVFEVVYYTLSPDYNVYMDIQQAINLGILRAFTEQGISLAYPTRTVIMRTGPSAAESPTTETAL